MYCIITVVNNHVMTHPLRYRCVPLRDKGPLMADRCRINTRWTWVRILARNRLAASANFC